MMYCPNCGSSIGEESKFCTNCGRAVSKAPEQESCPVQEQQYPAPPSGQGENGDSLEPMSVRQYLGMMLLMSIPIANIVLLFVWAFGGATNRNKRNYCKASLLLMAIAVCVYLVILLVVVLFAVAFGMSISHGFMS